MGVVPFIPGSVSEKTGLLSFLLGSVSEKTGVVPDSPGAVPDINKSTSGFAGTKN